MKSWQTMFFAILFWIACVLDVFGVIETQYEYLKFIEIVTAIILVVLADIQDKLDKLNK